MQSAVSISKSAFQSDSNSSSRNASAGSSSMSSSRITSGGGVLWMLFILVHVTIQESSLSSAADPVRYRRNAINGESPACTLCFFSIFDIKMAPCRLRSFRQFLNVSFCRDEQRCLPGAQTVRPPLNRGSTVFKDTCRAMVLLWPLSDKNDSPGVDTGCKHPGTPRLLFVTTKRYFSLPIFTKIFLKSRLPLEHNLLL